MGMLRRMLYGGKSPYLKLAEKHIKRVLSDGGVIPSKERLVEYIKFISKRPLYEYALAADPHVFGYKLGATSTSVSKVYSLLPESDLVQTTASAQPLLLTHDGVNNYWTNQSIANNYVSTPSAPINQITGDIDISAKVYIRTGSATPQAIIGKYGASNGSKGYLFTITTQGQPTLFISIDGTAVVSVGSVNLTDGLFHLRVTRVAATGLVRFFTSSDGTTWTQISQTTSTSGNIFNTPYQIEVGMFAATTYPTKSNIYSAQIYNGIRENGGTLAVSFDANDYRRYKASHQNDFVSSLTGEVWTINTDSNTTGYKGVLVDRTMYQTDGADDKLQTAAMSLNQPIGSYVSNQIFNTVDTSRRIFDGPSGPHMMYWWGKYLNLHNGGGIIATPPMNQTSDWKRLHVLSGVHNGANSRFIKNQDTPLTGDVGTYNPGGIIIGGDRTGTANMFLNGLYGVTIFTRTADNSAQQKAIQDFILSKLKLNIEPEAQAHYDRVIADGGVIPSLTRLNDCIKYLKSIRSLTEFAMVTDPHIFGYKLGATSTQVSKLYSLQPESDLVQTTAASQPLLHEWMGENYWDAPQVNNNSVICDFDPVNKNVNTGFTITSKISKSYIGDITARWHSSTGAFWIELVGGSGNTRGLVINTSAGGVSDTHRSASATNAIPVINQNFYWIKCTYDCAGAILTCGYSLDGVTYTNISMSTTAGTFKTSLGSVAGKISIGSRDNGSYGLSTKGQVYKVEIRNISNTLLYNFDANDYRKADPTNQASWVASTTGETWTINTDSNATGYKGVLVDRTMFQTDGTDDNLKTGVMTLNQPVSMYFGVNVLNSTGTSRRLIDGQNASSYFAINTINQYALAPGAGIYSAQNSAVYKKVVLLGFIANTVGTSSISMSGIQLTQGSVGSNPFNGFTIGSAWWNGEFTNGIYSAIIATRTADNASQQLAINQYLRGIQNKLY